MVGVTRARLAVAAAVLGAVLFAAAWNDRLPGGWRLRALFVDPAAQARGAYASHRAERLGQFASENATAAPGAVVFLGSSTIERFPLERCFPRAPALDRGIASEPLDDLAARLEASLPDAALGGMVVYAASPDFRRDPSRPEQLARRAGALLDTLERLRPGVPLCVLGLLPERNMAAEDVGRLERFDAGLAREAAARGATFVRTARAPLADGNGALEESFSCDRLHLSSDGYTVLARWILEAGGPVGRALAP